MNKPIPSKPKMHAAGVATCVIAPMGESGLEGYNARESYRFMQMENATGLYFRVFPETDPKGFAGSGYYETCGPKVFKRFFQIVNVTEGSLA